MVRPLHRRGCKGSVRHAEAQENLHAGAFFISLRIVVRLGATSGSRGNQIDTGFSTDSVLQARTWDVSVQWQRGDQSGSCIRRINSVCCQEGICACTLRTVSCEVAATHFVVGRMARGLHPTGRPVLPHFDDVFPTAAANHVAPPRPWAVPLGQD